MSTTQKPDTKATGQKPVFRDGDFSVFLDTRTIKEGAKAGESYEDYSVVYSEDQKTVDRVSIYKHVNGYDLKPEEALALARGDEVLVERPTKEDANKTFFQIIAPLAVVETPGSEAGKVFKRQPVAVAFANMNEDKSNVVSFSVERRDGEGKIVKGEQVNFFRSVGPKPTAERDSSIKVRIAAAIRAMIDLANGKPAKVEAEHASIVLEAIRPSEKFPGKFDAVFAKKVEFKDSGERQSRGTAPQARRARTA